MVASISIQYSQRWERGRSLLTAFTARASHQLEVLLRQSQILLLYNQTHVYKDTLLHSPNSTPHHLSKIMPMPL